MVISIKTVSILLMVFINVCQGIIFFRTFKTCGNPPIKVNFDFKDDGDNSNQMISGNYSSKIPNGENLKATMKAQFLARTTWRPLFSFSENKGVCRIMEVYVGPLFHDSMKAAGMIPTCPIPAGTFHWTNYRPNLNTMKLTLPPGRMRLRIEGIDKKTNKIAFCAEVELENK